MCLSTDWPCGEALEFTLDLFPTIFVRIRYMDHKSDTESSTHFKAEHSLGTYGKKYSQKHSAALFLNYFMMQDATNHLIYVIR